MNKYDITVSSPFKKKKKTNKLRDILVNATIIAGLGFGAYKAVDIYIDGAVPDLKSNAEWIETDFNTNADLGAFLYHSHKKEGGKYMYEGPSRTNYSASVEEYNQEKNNDPKKTGKIYLPDTNKDGEVGPGNF
jgi:hypothetical protein